MENKVRAGRLVVGLVLLLAASAQSSGASALGLGDGLQKSGLVDRGGPVLKAAKVELIFWGPTWTKSDPSAGSITKALQAVLKSSYMSSLQQYRGIKPASYVKSLMVKSPAPPVAFQTQDVKNFLRHLLDLGAILDTNPESLFLVFLPVLNTVAPENAQGLHGNFGYWDLRTPFMHSIRFAWIAAGDALEAITAVSGHELVEAASDPNLNAFALRGAACDKVVGANGTCEISDVCKAEYAASEGDLGLEAYWSEKEQSCVMPVAMDANQDLIFLSG